MFCLKQAARVPCSTLRCVSRTFTTERYKNGPQELRIWESTSGGIVAQHDEVEDFDAVKWAIDRARHHVLTGGSRRWQTSSEDARSMLMTARFLHDLETRVEQLSQDELGTCAVELFERPWVVSRGGSTWSRGVEVLQLRPRPDSLARRVAMAALSPVVAPVGAFVTYLKAGSANSVAACKWYFRAVTEIPCRVQLDRCYHVVDGDLPAMAEAVALGEDVRNAVHGFLPHLGAAPPTVHAE